MPWSNLPPSLMQWSTHLHHLRRQSSHDKALQHQQHHDTEAEATMSEHKPHHGIQHNSYTSTSRSTNNDKTRHNYTQATFTYIHIQHRQQHNQSHRLTTIHNDLDSQDQQGLAHQQTEGSEPNQQTQAIHQQLQHSHSRLHMQNLLHCHNSKINYHWNKAPQRCNNNLFQSNGNLIYHYNFHSINNHKMKYMSHLHCHAQHNNNNTSHLNRHYTTTVTQTHQLFQRHHHWMTNNQQAYNRH